jgi:hypothetical protein
MHRALIPILAISFLASPQAAAAKNPELISVHIVSKTATGKIWTTGPTEARLADKPQLAVIGIARKGKRRLLVADSALGSIKLRGVRTRGRITWAELGRVSVQWAQVEPHAWRQKDVPASNGATTRYHSNVSTTATSFGKWLGYDAIRYFESPLGSWSAKPATRIRPAVVKSKDPTAPDFGGLGTMRYRVTVRVNGKTYATPGAEAVDKKGILPSVHRVSIRKDDSVLGHLTAFYLVPEVFGSAGQGRNHQTERFIGADCADVITGAVREAGFRKVWHTNVAGLTRYARAVTKTVELDREGNPGSEVAGIAEGDIIRIDYGGSLSGHTPRSWDHVALLFEDRSDPKGPLKGKANGKLDGFDLVIHMGHPRLEVEPLSGQSPAKVDILRWDPKKLRRR